MTLDFGLWTNKEYTFIEVLLGLWHSRRGRYLTVVKAKLTLDYVYDNSRHPPFQNKEAHYGTPYW